MDRFLRGRCVVATLVLGVCLLVPDNGTAGESKASAAADKAVARQVQSLDKDRASNLWSRVRQFVLRVLSDDLTGPKP